MFKLNADAVIVEKITKMLGEKPSENGYVRLFSVFVSRNWKAYP